ncbi:MAG TPA: hypothetical protein VJN68_15535 [Burkholderiaceae bacterium]|nr:hypothetical protein [Burkholderiaceae bacterium]
MQAEEQEPDKVWSDTIRRETAPEHELAPRPVPDLRRAPGDRPRPQFWLAIALGLAVLGLVLIVGVTFVQWRSQAAAQETLRLNQEAQRQAQAQIEQMQREALARQAQLEVEQQRQEEKRIQAFNEQQRAADEARRAEEARADRREKAWARFYRPPPHCETAATMECTNRYIRARRAFDEKFAKGEL